MVIKKHRKDIYNKNTGRMPYFFNTEEGMVRACAYWLIMKPREMEKLRASERHNFKSFIIFTDNEAESLSRVLMISSLGFRIHSFTSRIVNPRLDGKNYFLINYAIAKNAIAREGGPERIDNKKLVMWKHRTYLQAMSVLQFYASDFRKLVQNLKIVPDVPGWVSTATENMIKGVDTVDTDTAIRVAVSTCNEELETEKRFFEAELRRKDQQIDELTRTIAEMSRSSMEAIRTIRESTPPPLPPREEEEEMPPPLPPRPEIVRVSPPRAPPVPDSLIEVITKGRQAIQKSVKMQRRDEGAERRIQQLGEKATQEHLAEIRKGLVLKPVQERKMERMSPDSATKSDDIRSALIKAMEERNKFLRQETPQESPSAFNDDDYDDYGEGEGLYAASSCGGYNNKHSFYNDDIDFVRDIVYDIGSWLHPFFYWRGNNGSKRFSEADSPIPSPRDRKKYSTSPRYSSTNSVTWKNKLNDVFS